MIFIYCLIVVIFVVLLYITIKYINKPIRRLKVAQKKKAVYFLDNPANARENFLITYKGFLLEGEKYTDNHFNVTSVFICFNNNSDRNYMHKEDYQEIEKVIRKHYPSTSIDWKSAEPSS